MTFETNFNNRKRQKTWKPLNIQYVDYHKQAAVLRTFMFE